MPLNPSLVSSDIEESGGHTNEKPIRKAIKENVIDNIEKSDQIKHDTRPILNSSVVFSGQKQVRTVTSSDGSNWSTHLPCLTYTVQALYNRLRRLLALTEH